MARPGTTQVRTWLLVIGVDCHPPLPRHFGGGALHDAHIIRTIGEHGDASILDPLDALTLILGPVDGDTIHTAGCH